MEMQVDEVDGITLVLLDGRFDIAGAQAVDLHFSALAGSRRARRRLEQSDVPGLDGRAHADAERQDDAPARGGDGGVRRRRECREGFARHRLRRDRHPLSRLRNRQGGAEGVTARACFPARWKRRSRPRRGLRAECERRAPRARRRLRADALRRGIVRQRGPPWPRARNPACADARRSGVPRRRRRLRPDARDGQTARRRPAISRSAASASALSQTLRRPARLRARGRLERRHAGVRRTSRAKSRAQAPCSTPDNLRAAIRASRRLRPSERRAARRADRRLRARCASRRAKS